MFNHFFCLKDNKIRHGPHMNRQKRYRDLLRFCEDIRWQNLKIECPHNFSSGTDVFNYCYWITHQSSFKICEKPSKFSKSVCVVKDYANIMSAKSTTISARVSVVKDYATRTFRKYQIIFFVTFWLVFYLLQSKIISSVSA